MTLRAASSIISAPSWMYVYGFPVSRSTIDAIVGTITKTASTMPRCTQRLRVVNDVPWR